MNQVKTTQHYLGHRNRLRKRILDGKEGAIPDYEILELLLFGANQRQDVKPLAKRLINELGGFHRIFYATTNELEQVDGVNLSAMAIIKAVREALNLILKTDIKSKPILNNWKSLINYLRVTIGNSTTENFRVLFLNKKHTLITEDVQDVGTIDRTPIYIREIIKKALLVGASSIIISHNHPSNDSKPSQSDINATMQLQQACASVDIRLIDHIVITANNHFSFASNGLM